ncbi:MAG: proline/glycine betaine ABC transporter permease [Burkholderiales bacterium]|nr:proline/glycine betaine ABC transporter permease [Burkholderiales bacterium]
MVEPPLIPLAEWIDRLVDWLVVNYGDRLGELNNWIVHKIGFFERFLSQSIAWPLMMVGFAALAYHASRSLRLAAGVAAALALKWSQGRGTPTKQTLALLSVALVVTVALGLPLGVLMSQSDRVRALMTPVLDFMQTMPSFVYLIPVVMLFGLGTFSGVIATTIYAAPPLVRLTDLGIRLVDKELIEAATAFGATRRQTLFGVQIPLALPNVMAGVNQSIMMALAMVVIASMIGVRGLGQEVLYGLQRQEPGTGFVAGLSIVLLAIVLDRITQAYGRRLAAHRHVPQ